MILKIVNKNEKILNVSLNELKKAEKCLCKKTLAEVFQIIKIDISNAYLDYILKQMIVEVKSIWELEAKHLFKVLKRKEQINVEFLTNKNEDYNYDNIGVIEVKQKEIIKIEENKIQTNIVYSPKHENIVIEDEKG